MSSIREAACSIWPWRLRTALAASTIGRSAAYRRMVRLWVSAPPGRRAGRGSSNSWARFSAIISGCSKARITKNSTCLLSLAFGAVVTSTVPGEAERLNSEQFSVVAENCAASVSLDILSGIASVESKFHPYAIGVGGSNPRSIYPKTHAEAVQIAQQLIEAGERFDAGIAQINVENWDWLGLSASTVFDVCTNLTAAEVVLRDGYDRARAAGKGKSDALRIALSTYNTGHSKRGVTNGYVGKVLSDAGRTGSSAATQVAPPQQSSQEEEKPDWDYRDVYGSPAQASANVFE